MSTAIPTFAFATADELRRIFLRAFEAFELEGNPGDDDFDHGDTDQVYRDNLRHDAAVQALRFCCLAAGQLGDASLLPLVVSAIALCGHFHDDRSDHATTLGWGLAQLLERGAALDDDDGQELVTHRDAKIRNALARSLVPRDAGAIALLEALSIDPAVDVRNAAKKTLGEVREVAWWKGKFASDPLSRLTADEAAEHKATLERISAILDLHGSAIAHAEPELVELAETLPHALAAELAVSVLGAREPYSHPFTQLGTMLLTREGGDAAFIRLCDRWNGAGSRFMMGNSLAPMVLALPIEIATTICLRLTAAVCRLSSEERAKQTGNAVRIVAETAAYGFPPGADLTPMLDAILALPPVAEHELDWVASSLSQVFAADEADPMPILDRIFEARLAGYPGPWKQIGYTLDKLMSRAPGAAIRPLAERAMTADDDALVAWGLAQILRDAHDPDRDPPAPELAARFFAEPRYRRIMVASWPLTSLVLPLLRAELREGRLGFEEAATTVAHLGQLHGGVARRNGIRAGREVVDPAAVEASLAKARDAIDAFLGPEELRGPLTCAEWLELRAARRRRAEAPDVELAELLYPLPTGPWEPEDLALLERCVALVRDGEAEAAVDVAAALSAKPDRDLYPKFEVIFARAPSRCRGLIRMCWRGAAETLGLPSTGPLGNAPRVASESDGEDEDDDEPDDDVQWMDEPDD